MTAQIHPDSVYDQNSAAEILGVQPRTLQAYRTATHREKQLIGPRFSYVDTGKKFARYLGTWLLEYINSQAVDYAPAPQPKKIGRPRKNGA